MFKCLKKKFIIVSTLFKLGFQLVSSVLAIRFEIGSCSRLPILFRWAFCSGLLTLLECLHALRFIFEWIYALKIFYTAKCFQNYFKNK
ncbi:unnamed protein product [Meloidogyne enterolobii]|uniref:Uncharacterized protein n=1 Tax=Meloidogyne enterolobii TaxID=390850 RepID=A0ACB0XWP4_MELEN